MIIVKYLGGSTIIGASYNTTSFTFSCVTSGGGAAYINKDQCGSEQQLMSFSQQILDRSTMRYNSELRWDSRSQGSYICSTRNGETVSYAVLLTEVGIGNLKSIIITCMIRIIKTE